MKDAVRIDEVVGEQVALRPAGIDSFKGLCPFHDERTPSFHVRPSLGLWHCFGCARGGDVIAFVQEINHMGFSDAVEMLAQKVGITLHYEEGGRAVRTEEPGKRQRLLDAHRAAEDFYATHLLSPEAHHGRTFLADRGFTEGMSRHFGVGYAPQSWDSLTRHLRSRGFTDDELVSGGLASRGSRGIYDRFRGRLIWPIRDVTGATVGFGARRLDDTEDSPKYLNTPETPIYKKSHVLYGLDLARKEISKNRRIVIVEGYTDVMAAHVAGVPYAVATCGTAFGSEHVRLVRRLLGDSADPAAGVCFTDGHAHGGEVIFTFDGDAAGRKAALRAFSEDQNFATQTFVAVEKSGLDPCDLRMEYGDQAILELVESRIPLFEFVIRSVLNSVDLRTVEGRVGALRSSAPVVAGIKDRALRAEYVRELSGWIGMDITDVNRAVRQAASELRRAQTGHAAATHPRGGEEATQTMMAGAGRPRPSVRRGPEDPVSRIERQALEALLQHPIHLIGSGFEELEGTSFSVPTHRAVHDAIRAAGGLETFQTMLMHEEKERGVGEAAIAAATKRFLEEIRTFAGPLISDAVSQLAVTPLEQDRHDQMRPFCRGLMAAMVRMDLTRRTGELRALVQRLPESDPAHSQAFEDLMRLEHKRRHFSEYEQ